MAKIEDFKKLENAVNAILWELLRKVLETYTGSLSSKIIFQGASCENQREHYS